MNVRLLLSIALVFVSVILLSVGVEPDETDYCRYVCKFDCSDNCRKGIIKHLRCELRPKNKDENCFNIEPILTPTRRKELLQWINDYREQVAAGQTLVFNGSASNMRQLSWDYKLEEFAIVAGSQCGNYSEYQLAVTYPCAGTTDFPHGTSALSYGLLTALSNDAVKVLSRASEINIPREILDQYIAPPDANLHPDDLFKDLHSGGPGFVPGKYASHTALIWAKSSKVGCSIIKCNCEFVGQAASLEHVVCFFGVKPNVPGESVIQKGDLCSECPSGTTCKKTSSWPNLCAAPDEPDRPVDLEDIAPRSGSSANLQPTFALTLLILTCKPSIERPLYSVVQYR